MAFQLDTDTDVHNLSKVEVTMRKKTWTNKGKKVYSTLVTIGLFLGWLFGVIADAPMGVNTVFKKAPDIIQSPNTWWTIACAAGLLLTMRWIWSHPDEEEIDGIAEAIMCLFEDSDLSPQESWQFAALADVYGWMRRFNKGVLNDNGFKTMRQSLEYSVAQKIENGFGKDARKEYLKMLNTAKQESLQASVVLEMCFDFVRHRIFNKADSFAKDCPN